MALFEKHKGTPRSLDKRRQQVEEELEKIRHDLKLLTKFVEKPQKQVDLSQLKVTTLEQPPEVAATVRRDGPPFRRVVPAGTPPSAPAVNPGGSRTGALAAAAPSWSPPGVAASPPGSEQGPKVRNDKFADYLATGFQDVRSLRNEQRIWRNKAIFVVVFVLILLVILISRLLP